MTTQKGFNLQFQEVSEHFKDISHDKVNGQDMYEESHFQIQESPKFMEPRENAQSNEQKQESTGNQLGK